MSVKRARPEAGPLSRGQGSLLLDGDMHAESSPGHAIAGARSETNTEHTEFLAGGLRPHTCSECGTCVLVKKNSLKHTSIQWTTDAASSCPVFAAAGTNTALLDTCARLSASIAAAVREGDFGVLDD